MIETKSSSTSLNKWQDHRLVEIQEHLWKISGPTPPAQVGPRGTGCYVQTTFEQFQGVRLFSPLWATCSRINKAAAVSLCWPAAQPFRVQGKNKHYNDTLDISTIHIWLLFMKKWHKNEHKFKNIIIVLLRGKVVTDHAKKPVCSVRKDQENCNLHLNFKKCSII